MEPYYSTIYLLKKSMIKNRLILVLFTLLFCIPSAFAKDFKEPQQAIDAYIAGVSTGSGKHIEMAYTKDATIKFYDRDQRFWEYTRESFAEAVNTGQSWDAEIETTALLISGNAASATVEFTWGENQEHGYVDYLNLIKSNGSWNITGKVAQYVSRK